MLFAKNLQFFFAKLVQSVSLCHMLSKKLNFIKIWQVKVGQNKDLVCYRQKQSFRQCACGLRQLVLKPGFRPKERALSMLEKSENFNSLRPILFELWKKKTTGIGLTQSPKPIGLFLSNIDRGGGGRFPLYDFALWDEIQECDACFFSKFSRPCSLKKIISLTLMVRVKGRIFKKF